MRRLIAPRVITFDLDDTLWDAAEVLTRAEISFHVYLQQHYPRLASSYDDARFRTVMKEVMASHQPLSHDFTFIRKEALRRCVADVGEADESIVESAFQAFLAERSRPVLFPGVLETLRDLRNRGITLGSITNGNADIAKMPVIFNAFPLCPIRPPAGHARLAELSELFSFTVSSIDVGAGKPHAAPFLRALELSGCLPSEIIHVGDSFQHDIVGARAVGMRTVWVKNPNPISIYESPRLLSHDDHDTKADVEVHSINELRYLIQM